MEGLVAALNGISLKKKLFILAFIITGSLSGQNLVLNPSFEEFEGKIAKGPVQGDLIGVNWWNRTNSTTPDIYTTLTGTVPYHEGGAGCYQFPRSGNSYMGQIFIDALYIRPTRYREYFDGTLKDTLVKGKRYAIHFYVNCQNGHPDHVMYTSDLMLGFRSVGKFVNSQGRIRIKPAIRNPAENLITDTLNWVKVSGIYEAKGWETNVVIGTFSPKRKLHIKKSVGGGRAYYYVDDVSVVELDEAFDSTCKEIVNVFRNQPLGIVPNVGDSLILNNPLKEKRYFGLTDEAKNQLNELVDYMLNCNRYMEFKLNCYVKNPERIDLQEKYAERLADEIIHYLKDKGIGVNRFRWKGIQDFPNDPECDSKAVFKVDLKW